MPSRGFLTSPITIDDFPDSHVSQNEGSLAAPVPVAASHEGETEWALDLRGCKHAETDDLNYQGYVLQQNPPSTRHTFAMPGLASANMLRAYLHDYLQPHQVTDEYGATDDIANIRTDHLTVLQAKLWSEVLTRQSVSRTEATHPSRADKHVFILCDATDSMCHYMADLDASTRHLCHSTIVRVEPLVHWGTVDFAAELQSIICFRREGSLMQKEEYRELVKKMTDSKAPMYCIDCLGHLCSKRTEARETKKQRQDAPAKYRSLAAARAARPQTRARVKSPESVPSNVASLASSATRRAPAQGSNLPSAKSEIDLRKLLPQCDGASEYLKKTKVYRDSAGENEQDAIYISSSSDDFTESHNQRVDSMPCEEYPASSSPSVFSSSDAESESFASPPSELIDNSTNGIQENDENMHDEISGVKFAEVIDLITPPRKKGREFGHELDTNTKVSPLRQLRRSPRNHKVVPRNNATMSAVRPMKTLKRAIRPVVVKKYTKKRTNLLTGRGQTQDKALATTSEPFEYREPIATSDPIEEIYLLSWPSPLPLKACFTRRPKDEEKPHGIATEVFDEFVMSHPGPNAKICVCNKPANHIIANKDEPQIAQCSNPMCRFRWYHYWSCLDVSEKGKARAGTFTCQICQNEEAFTVKGIEDSWSLPERMEAQAVIKQVREEIGMWHLQPIGGVAYVANPYGLAKGADEYADQGAEDETEEWLSVVEA
ncbi:hypothetical protein E8E13_003016 [Curvularia kusanoi]|uniref:Zinc finger PHD-type domain-containing protein n=1 Tax=Curvularia kusanoi TaxID=90978 RepID=A0A9P4T5L2_CURKU|nr:hypothetical protein E8E13_003016 [Curvularia kusanoi]